MTLPSPDKSLGIWPYACTAQQLAQNFSNIINNFTNANNTGIAPVRFRLTEFLQHGSTLGAAAKIVEFDGTNYIVGDTIHVFDWYIHTNPLEPYDNMGWWWGEIGTEGWARKREKPLTEGRAEYDIIWMECEQVIRFKLTSDLNTGNDSQPLGADGVIRRFNGTAYEDSTVAIKLFDFQGQSPTGDATDRGMWQGIAGMEGIAVLRHRSATAPTSVPQYDIIWMEQYAFTTEATLTTDMAGGTATASVSIAWEQGLSPPTPFTLHDDRNAFPDAISGCRAVLSRSEYDATTIPGTPYYHLVHCTHPVFLATGTLTAAMCGDAPVFNNWAGKAIGDFKVDPGAGTVTNPFAHAGLIGDTILMVRSNNASPFTWWVIDVTKHEEQLITGVRWNSTDKCLQRTQRLCFIETCEPESEWINIICGATCP